MKPQFRMLIVLATGVFAVTALTAFTADWPQWRGPNRDGISDEKGLLQEWPKDGPKLQWKIQDLGMGYSTPAVVKDRLYLLSNEGLENESVQARATEGGKLIWSTRVGKVGNPDQRPPYPGARSTPTVDGQSLFVLGSDGDLACLNASDGKIRWQKNVRIDFGGQPGRWAYSESPLVDGDLVICTPGGEKATLVALNKNSGDMVWQSSVPGGDEAGYASIVIMESGGMKQYVQLLAKGVVGVDAKTGKLLWRYDKIAQGSLANIPTPIIHGDTVYSSTGKGGGALVTLKIDQGAVNAVEKYYSAKLPTSIGGAVKVGDYLYGTNTQGLMCIDFSSSDVKWQDRSVGPGSVCFADGRLYVHGESGEVALVEATPEGYREKGRFTPPDQPDRGRSQAWTYPVVSNGKLYLRDFGMLWCYDIARSK